MPGISNKAIDLIEPALGQGTAEDTGRVFFGALQDLGVRAIYARAYRRPTPVSVEKEQVYSRLSPAGWESLYAEKQFQNVNYLPREVRRRADPFRWSEVALTGPAEQGLARALIDYGCADGLAIPCHGPGGYVGVVSLAFEQLDEVAPAERAAVQFASLVLHDHMRKLAEPPEAERPQLTRRERDCLAFVAQGKSDWDISVILGISHTTVISHVQNAKRKIGALTRAQAVAQCLIQGLI